MAQRRNKLVRQIRMVASGVEEALPNPAKRIAEALVRMLIESRDVFSKPPSVKYIDSTSIVA